MIDRQVTAGRLVSTTDHGNLCVMTGDAFKIFDDQAPRRQIGSTTNLKGRNHSIPRFVPELMYFRASRIGS